MLRDVRCGAFDEVLIFGRMTDRDALDITQCPPALL